MNQFANFIIDFLSQPPIVIGLFAASGLILSKKDVTKVIDGTIKAILGFVLLSAGASVLGVTLDNVNTMFVDAFNIQGVIPLNEAVITMALAKFGATVSIVMVASMLFNMVLAKISPFKYIFLTGHHILYMSALVVAVLTSLGYDIKLVAIVATIVVGSWMTLSPAILQRYTRRVTGSGAVALGHAGSFNYFMAAQVGKLFKNSKSSKSIEDLNMPEKLNFLRDSTIQIAISMIILLTILSLFTPSTTMESLTDGGSEIVFIIMQAFNFTAGIWIVLQGVKMTISELVPAFKGISDKVIPGATPALDCPVVFPYSTNAVLVGFVCSLIAGTLTMFILPMFGLVIIIPVVMNHFFVGATCAIYGNSTGGYKGAIAGAITGGVLMTILPALLYPILESLSFVGTTFADSDMALIGIVIFIIGMIFKPA